MKKKFRILAAALAICLSVFCSPLALADAPSAVQAAVQPAAIAQTISTKKKTEEQVWIPKTGKKYHKKSSCSNMKNPEKVSLSTAKERGYTACKKCYG